MIDQEYVFPEPMLASCRWMSRTRGTKLPFSALDKKPEGVTSDKWRYEWNDKRGWASFDQAMKCTFDDPTDFDGLCYVLHPAGDDGDTKRLICFDFDNAIDDDGNLDPAVCEFLSELNTYVEMSVRGRGVHAFVWVVCKPFKNALQRPFGECKVDVLCSSQVAVTGTVFSDYGGPIGTIDRNVIDRFELKDRKEVDGDTSEAWGESFEPAGGTDYLVEHMEAWEPCFRSSKGSNLGEGGDVEMFRAACHLARRGVTGDEAVKLLGHVPADPPFNYDELRHKVDSAFKSVHTDEGDFGSQSADFEFDEIKGAKTYDDEILDGLGLRTAGQLFDAPTDDSFVIDGLLVHGPNLIIGGKEKCFKTGVAADLLVSLLTGAPFLNEFECHAAYDCAAFFTAEIGCRGATRLLRRILRAKDLRESSIRDKLFVSDRVPTFSKNKSGVHIDERTINYLNAFLRKRRPAVAVFDPLYLALGQSSVGDMYEIGQVLQGIRDICEPFGTWPIFCHHSKKVNDKEWEPMELSELYGAGASQFARQWLLMSHAEPYVDGKASLYMNAGGSDAGDCGLWRTEIFEGKADALLDRKWDITVYNDEGGGRESHLEAILAVLAKIDDPQNATAIAEVSKVTLSATKDILSDLFHEGKVTFSNNKYQLSVHPENERDF